ncbi:hypothetical protein E2C01_024046 [Portunus trituberculatus]|uniref:Uncharacterized protein n=1 Tax=Portunus trituberculatus TaxID=210409 RepID=A0A5B7EBK4_PORTR|nr:hypothetical protein [Portunus trituberculatus]
MKSPSAAGEACRHSLKFREVAGGGRRSAVYFPGVNCRPGLSAASKTTQRSITTRMGSTRDA